MGHLSPEGGRLARRLLDRLLQLGHTLAHCGELGLHGVELADDRVVQLLGRDGVGGRWSGAVGGWAFADEGPDAWAGEDPAVGTELIYGLLHGHAGDAVLARQFPT